MTQRKNRAFMMPSDASRHLHISSQLLNHHITKKNIVARELPLYTKCPYTGEMVFVTTKRLVELDMDTPVRL